MLQKSDRALRLEITRLAKLDADDIAAVLDELEPKHRVRVEALLHELVAPHSLESADAPFGAWVEERLDGRIGGMTDSSRRLLADCAERISPRVSKGKPTKSAPSLFERAITSTRRNG